ncbi:hypothetical protein [Kineococcus aurantiacus]|uniref:Uncharacterized protein n=1 Tax=Kineococcus aurantiacus TaxID=37633 RepID=A0A7Y9ASY4_9ACTN|nr:hypothetical protein [Kineococcus aurantiacus]NYD21482.1 hypothetical protein [Kineococcus aurantiacus]
MANIGTKSTQQTSTKPAVHWVTVRDASGRPHLEMRWSIAGAHAPLSRAA